MLFTEVFANGGIQRFNRTFIAACGRLAIQCDVLCLNDSPQSIAREGASPSIRVRGCSGNRLRYSLATARAVWRNEYDWVVIGHINLLSMTIATLMTKPFSRTRAVLITHGIEIWNDISSRRRRALLRVQTILCVSQYTRDRILQQTPALRAERLRIFPNALSETWESETPVASTHELPQRFILSVTRLERGDRYKGIVTVIEALSMLKQSATQYIVVGHGNDLQFLKLVAARCGVQDRVHFLRGISDAELVRLYRQCDAFILPSGKEGFGIVFLEAMYFGAPVIAAAEKGALDVVRHGETGLLVRFGDSMAVKDAIERLAEDPGLRDQLRKTGRATVVDDGAFTFLRFVERCAQIFDPIEARTV